MTQRFLSCDSIAFEAGDYNFYRYVGNDCVNHTDPSGLDPRLNGRGVPAAMGGDANSPINSNDSAIPISVSSDNHTTMTPEQQADNEFYRENGLLAGNCAKEGHWSAIFPILDVSPKGCVKHDACYSDCSKSKNECDEAFAKTNPLYAYAVTDLGKETSDGAYKEAQKKAGCPCK